MRMVTPSIGGPNEHSRAGPAAVLHFLPFWPWRRHSLASTKEAPLHEILRGIFPNDLVFDIGANMGNKTATFLERGARVVAVEPQPAMLAILRERFGDNPNVTIVPNGLASKPGILTLNVDSVNPGISSFRSEWKDGHRFKGTGGYDQKVVVAITTLDQVVSQHGIPRYIKIDVEGFEDEVVAGLSRKAGIISFEYSPERFEDSNRVADRLASLGYTAFNASFGELESFVWPIWQSSTEVLNAIKHHADNVDPYNWGDIYAA